MSDYTVIKEMPLTKEQWTLLFKMEHEIECADSMLLSLVKQLAEYEVARQSDKWDEVARILGYEDLYAAHLDGVTLRISLFRHVVMACKSQEDVR